MAVPCRCTRRQLLISGLAAARLGAVGSKGTQFDSDWRRYPDPATELEVFRLTNPDYSSALPAYYNRAISRRSSLMLFACDRSGTMQAFRMELKSGETDQLTDAGALDASSLSLQPDGRSAVFFDGPTLRLLNLANLREREIYEVPDSWQRGTGASVTGDGAAALFVETQRDSWRLRSAPLMRGAASTVFESRTPVEHPVARPARAQVMYRQGDQGLWLVNSDGRQNRQLKLAAGRVGPANWSADGRIILYLLFPDDPSRLNEIREHAPDTNTDKLVAKTSQFVHFGFNRDTSVFVGASRNAGSPTILLLLRVTRREFTLCEHKASTPSMTSPVFSPDAQRVYFLSDRHGKPAIYCMHVEKLVEKIESES